MEFFLHPTNIATQCLRADGSQHEHIIPCSCVLYYSCSSHARLACITHAEHESALSMVSRVQSVTHFILRGEYKALQPTSASREPHKALCNSLLLVGRNLIVPRSSQVTNGIMDSAYIPGECKYSSAVT